MDYKERQQKELERTTLQCGAMLVKECIPKMQEGSWQHFTTAQKVFYLYMQAERHAKKQIAPELLKREKGLQRIDPDTLEKAFAGLIGLPPL